MAQQGITSKCLIVMNEAAAASVQLKYFTSCGTSKEILKRVVKNLSFVVVLVTDLYLLETYTMAEETKL